MTRLLLDTHIWLWSLLEPHKLFPSIASALEEDDENELWLSPISVWELVMLHGKRRMLLNADLET